MTKTTLDLIVIDDNLEALAVRACLERWGVTVNLHLIGKSSDLVSLFNEPERLSSNILITCHGTKKGIVLPELAPQIAKKEPYRDFITPANLKEFVNLKGHVVLSTGCVTGKQTFANVFMSRGAGAYIALQGYPEASAALLFVVNFYYFLLVKKLSVKEAYQKAVQSDPKELSFKLFTK